MKSETSGVMWNVAPESKIQLVNCELSPYFSLLRSSLLDIRAIDTYIWWSSLFFPLSHERLPFSLKRTCFCHFLLSFGGLGHFEIMRSSDPHLQQLRFDEKVNRACDNDKNNNEHKIYAYMALISSNEERSSEKYGDSLQWSNWILDSGATCHMTPEVSDSSPGSL